MSSLAAMSPQYPLLGVLPGACQARVAEVLGFSAIKLRLLPLGQGQPLRLGGDAVPKVLDELNLFRQG